MAKKKPSYQLVARDTKVGEEMYGLMADLIHRHHEHLDPARIALAWNFSWTPDDDGRLVLGRCKRASELDRELVELDFVIILLEPFWASADVTDEQRLALLDHELCHAAPKLDHETGDQVYDAHDRPLFRLRKHDVEEFACIVRRHGIWKGDLEVFARALFDAQATTKQMTLDGQGAPALPPGMSAVITDPSGRSAPVGSPEAASLLRDALRRPN